MDAHTIDIRLSLWELTDIKGIPIQFKREHDELGTILRTSQMRS